MAVGMAAKPATAEAAVLEDEDAVHAIRDRVIVRHDNEAGPEFAIQFEHQLQSRSPG